MHWQYRTIGRGENSILHNLNALIGSKANDYISFYGLRTYGKLSETGPVVTSQVVGSRTRSLFIFAGHEVALTNLKNQCCV